MTILGFDIADVPTADIMELAAKLLESDAVALEKIQALGRMLGAPSRLPETSHATNRDLAAALRQRAARVRALETQ